MRSLRPPVSSGQLQSRITEVSFMEEITFRGAEGGPGRQRREGEETEVRGRRSSDTKEEIKLHLMASDITDSSARQETASR